MAFTSRSVAVGLFAWCLAFLIAYIGRIGPILRLHDVGLLALSGVVGLVVVIIVGRRLCKRDFERGSAVMVFALSFFAGIYAPITTIWANATFYEWSTAHATKPKSHFLSQYVATAVEHTGASHYAGAIVILGIAWLIARQVAGLAHAHRPKLGWPELPDVAFGAATWVIGAATILISQATSMSALQWLGYTCGAFLFSLLFRSLRLQWRALQDQPSPASTSDIPRLVGTITIAALWLSFPVCTIAGIAFHASKEWIFGLATVGCILPWLFFRISMRGKSEARPHEHDDLTAFAMRCGFWSGMAIKLVVGGLVLTGMAANVLEKASDVGTTGLATPFALTVIALKPFYNLFALPSILAGLGGFLVAAILPSSTRASRRILTCAQGGLVLCAVDFVLLILFALNLALTSVPLIPVQKPLSPEVTIYFAPGNWYRLAFFDLNFLAFCVAAGAISWANQASIVCGVIWLKNRGLRKTITPNSVPPPLPASHPPTAPTS